MESPNRHSQSRDEQHNGTYPIKYRCSIKQEFIKDRGNNRNTYYKQRPEPVLRPAGSCLEIKISMESGGNCL